MKNKLSKIIIFLIIIFINAFILESLLINLNGVLFPRLISIYGAIAVLIILGLAVRSKRKELIDIILPLVLNTGTILFFINNKAWPLNQIITATSLILLFFWIKDTLIPSPKKARFLLISIFYSLSLVDLSLFNFMNNFAVSPWIVLTLTIFINILCFYHLAYYKKIFPLFSWLFMVLLAILLIQAFIIISFVPINIFSKSGFLVLIFYLYWGILSQLTEEKISVNKIIEYLGISIFLFLIIISSSSWSFLNIR